MSKKNLRQNLAPSQKLADLKPSEPEAKPSKSFTAYSLEMVNGYYAPVKHLIEGDRVTTSLVGVEDLAPNTLAKIGKEMMRDIQDGR